MKRIPLIKSVMTPFPKAIDIDDTIREARSLMVEHGIHHLPVIQRGKLVGVVTDRDIKRALDPDVGLPPKDQLFVRDVCVYEVYTVDLGERLDNVLMHMVDAHIGSVLVVQDGRLAGIFTTTDACREYAKTLRAFFTVESDEIA